MIVEAFCLGLEDLKNLEEAKKQRDEEEGTIPFTKSLLLDAKRSNSASINNILDLWNQKGCLKILDLLTSVYIFVSLLGSSSHSEIRLVYIASTLPQCFLFVNLC